MNTVFQNLTVFSIILLSIYIPVGVVVGHWHRNSQLPTESNINFLANPIQARMNRMLLQVLHGSCDKSEVDEMIRLLRQIEGSKI